MTRSTRVVVALGGNALLRRGERPELATQRARVGAAARAIAAVAREHSVIVTHGNGPQVGLLALQAEACSQARPYPLDALDAESEGLIGYLIEQALRHELPQHEIATLLTQVEVERDDPAFREPTKPIGPLYPRAEGERFAAERGWALAAEGDGVRRVVPSPAPRRIVELVTIRRLVKAGVLVVCAGGGGIPVVRTDGDRLEGVEAVVDKDLTAALLAEQLEADVLLLLTDVPHVYRDWPAAQDPIELASPEAMRALSYDAGSMGPKVEAACRFADSGGVAVIGALTDAVPMLAGRAGTRVERASPWRAPRAAAAGGSPTQGVVGRGAP